MFWLENHIFHHLDARLSRHWSAIAGAAQLYAADHLWDFVLQTSCFARSRLHGLQGRPHGGGRGLAGVKESRGGAGGGG